MTKQTLSGITLIATVAAMFITSIGDTIAHLQDWDGATKPEAVASVLRGGAQLALAALGGTLLPQGLKRRAGLRTRRTDRKVRASGDTGRVEHALEDDDGA